ncbi:MAG: hydrogen gas-evolving membrane-bound hydrogenase subunit E [Planctomycetota bacterium]
MLLLLSPIIVLAALAIAAPFFAKMGGRIAGYVLAIVPAAFFLVFASQLGPVTHGGAIEASADWIPAIGLGLDLRLDSLSLLFALLITGIGSLVLLYAADDLAEEPLQGRFFSYLIGFMVSMLGLVLSDNLLLTFIFWELTSITSYLLIGFNHDKTDSRKSALQALLVTGIGGLIMLAGLIMLGEIAGTNRISEIIALTTSGAIDPTTHALYVPAVLCILLGCFTKSAQFPFHFWLPNAMAAPSPVSAYLHSSTMVKAGVFLLARLNPTLAGSDLWFWALTGFGCVTMLVGAYLATRQVYLKKLLAYSTVSSLGIMVMFLGIGGDYGTTAAVAYIFAHALFKGTLFLVAGSITHMTGTKNAEQLGLLRTAMPLTAIGAAIGALSMAGVPPFNGFIAKELLLAASLKTDHKLLFTFLTFTAAAWTVFISFMIGWRVFFAKPDTDREPLPKEPREAPPAMWVGPLVLSAFALIAGVAPSLFAEPLIHGTIDSVKHVDPAYAAAHAGEAHAHKPMFFWYYLSKLDSLALWLSLAAIGVGFAWYKMRRDWKRFTQPIANLEPQLAPESWYFRIFDWTMDGAKWQTRMLQNGQLSLYIKTIVAAVIAVGWWAVWRTSDSLSHTFAEGVFMTPNALEVILAALIIIPAIIVTRLSNRLAAIATLGVVGYAIALVFVMFGAPDVAMTQFSIETLTVIIFVLVLASLPRFQNFERRPGRIFDAAISIAFGALMTSLVMVSNSEQVTSIAGATADPISRQFAQTAYLEAQGKNIVNVILVDFRGTDTLGEIFVLGLAAVGVFTLLTMRKRDDKKPLSRDSQTGATA